MVSSAAKALHYLGLPFSAVVNFIMDLKGEDKNATGVTRTSGGDVFHQEIASHHHDGMTLTTREPYGPAGFQGLFTNNYVAMCAAFATIGGLLFGYEYVFSYHATEHRLTASSQGVISVTLVMDQFLDRFPRVSESASGAGFWKGLMTAMLELGALIGALISGYLADRLSRKYSIIVAVVVFTIGSILQTAAVEYGMLTVGRLIGGLGIGA